MRVLRAANISEIPDPEWRWIFDRLPGGGRIALETFSMRQRSTIDRRPGGASLGRIAGAIALRNAARRGAFHVIVSHGPLVGAWSAGLLGPAKGAARHLLFSFNFTDLPRGLRRRVMREAFRRVDEFAVFTRHERDLYTDYFDIEREKIHVTRWGVAPPIAAPGPKLFGGPYLASLGGEARDYRTLCEAARMMPDMRFVVVARKANFNDVEPPANMTTLFDLPREKAWSIVAHSAAALLPLRSRDTPCGLVTLVGSLHLGKAQAVTAASGVSDYVEDGRTALLTSPGDAAGLAAAARRLIAEPGLAARLGAAAKTFAQRECSEAATIRFFADRLAAWFPPSAAPEGGSYKDEQGEEFEPPKQHHR